MRYVKIEDGTQWKGHLEVHETISGFSCFVCNDERFERTPLTDDAAETFQLGLPKDYHFRFQTRENAEAMLQRVAAMNGFIKMEDMI